MTTQTQLTAEQQLAHLHAPFPPEDLEWRFQSSGKGAQGGSMLPFIQNRAVMDRLDQIVGPGNWTSNVWSEGGPLTERVWYCRLKAKLADGRELEHVDVADATQIEPSKGGASDAMKRAAVKLGIGRYLYFLPKFYVDQKPSPMWKWHQHIASHMPQKCPWAVPGGAGRPPEGKGSEGWGFDTSYAGPAAAAPQASQQPRPQQQPPIQQPPAQRPPPQQQRQQEAFQQPQQRRPMDPPPRQDGEDPDCPLPQHSPPPFDLSERIPFGTNQGKAWGHMALGSPDGRRRGWLRWLYDNRESANTQTMRDAGFRAGQILAWLDGKVTPAEDPWAPVPQQQQEWHPSMDYEPPHGGRNPGLAPGGDPGYTGELGDDTPF